MTERLSHIERFVAELSKHVGGTHQDKYAKDRKYESVDVLNEWFGEDALLWTGVKYLSRYPRTKKQVDLMKAAHYLGMVFNRDFPPPVEIPAEAPEVFKHPATQPWAPLGVPPGVCGADGTCTIPPDKDLIVPINTTFGTDRKATVTFDNGILGSSSSFEDATGELYPMYAEFMQCLKIFEDRHHQRGPNNINKAGFEKVLVIIEEKLERAKMSYRLMQSSPAATGYVEAKKSLEDSLRDIANLSIIDLLYATGRWPKSV